jgi:hypothetical protein
MDIKRSILFSATAFALALGTAHAAGEGPPNFNTMDKNNDGALTRAEASVHGRLSAHFDQVDDDRDGRLTRAEYLEIMARQDLYTLRDSIAEFINPEGRPPLTAGQASGQQASEKAGQAGSAEQSSLPMAVSSELVRNVQQTLSAEGVDAGPVDGIWGPRTHQALREFQEREGLDASGQLNAPTLAALGIDSTQTASAGESASAGGTARSTPQFDKADKNSDGFVSRQEFDSALAPR